MRLVIYFDKHALRAYDWAKRHLGLSDHSISKFMGPVDRLRQWRHRAEHHGPPSPPRPRTAATDPDPGLSPL